MQILKEEKAQGAAEYILLFGGIIVIAVIAALFYKNYLNGLGTSINSGTDMQTLTGQNGALDNLSKKFQ